MNKTLQQLVDNFPWSYKDYHKDERLFELQILAPAGYSNVIFFNEDYDSFGPLVRCVKADKNGITERASYG